MLSDMEMANAVTRSFLEAFDHGRDGVRFIQVGSNDGEHDDPLRTFVLGGTWGGVLIEPVPFVFERLRRNYGHRDLVPVNAAISGHDGFTDFYCLAETSDPLPTWYDQLGSFTLETLFDKWTEKLIPDLRERIIIITVPCLTFESLCDKHQVGAADLVHLDTEGIVCAPVAGAIRYLAAGTGLADGHPGGTLMGRVAAPRPRRSGHVQVSYQPRERAFA